MSFVWLMLIKQAIPHVAVLLSAEKPALTSKMPPETLACLVRQWATVCDFNHFIAVHGHLMASIDLGFTLTIAEPTISCPPTSFGAALFTGFILRGGGLRARSHDKDARPSNGLAGSPGPMKHGSDGAA